MASPETHSAQSSTTMTAPVARIRTDDRPRSCDVVRVRAEDTATWDAYVHGHAEGTLFHTTSWRNAVCDSFPHEPIYLMAMRDGDPSGILPLFFVRSRLAGRMLVSVPYGVGGGILATNDDAVSALASAAQSLAEQRNCRVIDLRSAHASIDGWTRVDTHAGFARALPDRIEDVLEWLPRKARAAARNARDKYHLTVSYDDQHLAAVWRLYSISMRRLGSITYPYRFFQRLIQYTPNGHWVALVHREGRPIAGLVTFLHRDRVMPYFFGSTAEARACSAANFIYFSVMQRGVAAGYRVFDFGRSRCGNSGSYDFKRFNGFEPIPLGYQCYVPSGETPPSLSPSAARYRLARRIWKHLPLTITQFASARLAAHIPG